MSAQTVTPTFDNVIYVIGGALENQNDLLNGAGDGGIWQTLVAEGYNAYLSADGSEFGGVLNWDGSGEGFQEIQNELANGMTTSGNHITQIGLIGYSQGVGIATNLSNRLWENPVSIGESVAFAGTIDGVERDAVWTSPPQPEQASPAGIDLGWSGVASNWYQPNGYILPGIHGTEMDDIQDVAESNHELPKQSADQTKDQDHLTIAKDPQVVHGIINGLNLAFGFPPPF